MARAAITNRRAEISGLKELSITLNDLAKGLHGESIGNLGREVMAALGDTGREEIADRARSNARSQGLPQAVVDSIFVDARLSGIRKLRPTVLVGVNKRRTMVEWTATANPKSPRAKVGPGAKVAMSKATMYEFGTSRMRPRPYMRPALSTARVTLALKLKDKLGRVIERFADQRN